MVVSNKNTTTNFEGRSLTLSDSANIENDVYIGGSVIIDGDITYKGKVFRTNASGVTSSSDVNTAIANATRLTGVADNKSDLSSIIPSGTKNSDMYIDDDDSSVITNKVDVNVTNDSSSRSANDANKKYTLYAQQMYSAGAVMSSTGFCADNTHNCIDGTYSSDGDLTKKTYVLPNLVYTENLHCKRIYPKDMASDALTRDGTTWDNSEISVEAKRLKVDTLIAKNIGGDNNNKEVDEIKTYKLNATGDVTFGGEVNLAKNLKVGSGVNDNSNANIVTNAFECKDATVTNNLTSNGSVKASTMLVKTIKSDGNSGNPDLPNMLTIQDTIDGYPEILAGTGNAFYDKSDNDKVPFSYYQANGGHSLNVTLNATTFGSTTGPSPLTITSDSLNELEIFHGAYCTDDVAFQCGNILFEMIQKSNSLYYDVNKPIETFRTNGTSDNINMVTDMMNSSTLTTNFFKFFISHTGTNSSFKKRYIVENDTSYYIIYVDLKPYVNGSTSEYTSPYLRITINKQNMKCMFSYVKTKTDSSPLNYTFFDGSTESIKITEVVLQFLLINVLAETIRNLNSVNSAEALTSFYVGKSFNNPNYIKTWGQTMEIENEIYGEYIQWVSEGVVWEKNYWDAFKKYLLGSNFADNYDITSATFCRYVFSEECLIQYKSSTNLTMLSIYKFMRGNNPSLKWFIEDTSGTKTVYKIQSTDQDPTNPIFGSVSISTLTGDTTINGNLIVNEINSTDGRSIKMNKLDVQSITVNGVDISGSSSSVDGKYSDNRLTVPFYTKSKWGINDDLIGGDSFTFEVDVHYMGIVNFVAVRPIFVPPQFVELIYPAQSYRHGAGCFKVYPEGKKINPYNYEVVTDWTDPMQIAYKYDNIDTQYKVNFRYISSKTKFIVAKTTVSLYYIANDKLSQTNTTFTNITGAECKLKHDVYIATCIEANDYLNIYFPGSLSNYSGSKIAGYTLVYMIIGGFRYTSINANMNEANNGIYYTDITSDGTKDIYNPTNTNIVNAKLTINGTSKSGFTYNKNTNKLIYTNNGISSSEFGFTSAEFLTNCGIYLYVNDMVVVTNADDDSAIYSWKVTDSNYYRGTTGITGTNTGSINDIGFDGNSGKCMYINSSNSVVTFDFDTEIENVLTTVFNKTLNNGDIITFKYTDANGNSSAAKTHTVN